MKEYGAVIEDAVSIGLPAITAKRGGCRDREELSGYAYQSGVPGSRCYTCQSGWQRKLDQQPRVPFGSSGLREYLNRTGERRIGQSHRTCKAAIALVRDMGGNALKYFPMQGLKLEDEYRAVAKACAEEGFALEPTGGIDKENFEAIVRIAFEAGVQRSSRTCTPRLSTRQAEIQSLAMFKSASQAKGAG